MGRGRHRDDAVPTAELAPDQDIASDLAGADGESSRSRTAARWSPFQHALKQAAGNAG